MNKFFIILFALLLTTQIFAQKNSEFRTTWVVSWNLVNQYNGVEENKALCRKILDNHVKANMNAVLWHARQSGTAYYDSDIEPWGYYAGYKKPGYDIFEYAVQQAHFRGLEIHAWVNVFHCSSTKPGTPAAEHPEWVCTDQNGVFMTVNDKGNSIRCISPGIDSVRVYLARVAMEIVRKYDIDGIHFDFVRWNESTYHPSLNQINSNFSSESIGNFVLDGMITEKQIEQLNENPTLRYIYDTEHPYNSGVPDGFSTWDDWRRWSVTEFVKMVHDSIQAVKPWVRLSVAALGKYKWSSWQGYGTVFQDAALWFNEGYLDQLTPMHYHWLNPESFYNMLAGPNGDSGIDQCWGKYIQKGINDGRLFSCGPGSYLLLENDLWSNHVSIVNKAREVPWVDGFQFFSYASWRDVNYWQEAKELIFPNKVKIRATGLIDNTAPEAPTITLTKLDTTVYRISVYPQESGENPSWIIIYRSKDSALNLDEAQILNVKFTDRSFHYNDYITERSGGYFYYGVTALDRFWNESELSTIVKTDSIPEKSIVPNPVTFQFVKKAENGYLICWLPSGEEDNKGYRIYGKTGTGDWQLLLDESTLNETAIEVIVSVPERETGWLFTVRAVGLGPQSLESSDPDIYGGNNWTEQHVLVIDAFDRITGSWKEATHPFAQRVCQALNRLKISYDCGTNESFENRNLQSSDYDAIFWLAGDESTTDESVAFKEMSLLANYLKYGGKLLISGSEIGYDLDYSGNSQEKKFFNEYIKSKYISNGSNGNGYQTTGENRRIFSGLNFNFDDGNYGFNVRTPDVYDTTNGSLPCLNYQNGGIAGTQYVGTIGNGSETAKVISLGFPFETIYNETEIDSFLYRSLAFFDFYGTSGIATNKNKPKDFKMSYNYPNPFNSSTNIVYKVTGSNSCYVTLKIYDIKGREVKLLIGEVQNQGHHQIRWDGKGETGNNVSSGVYFYRLEIDQLKLMRKMLLIQ